jgi:hypothetical protein
VGDPHRRVGRVDRLPAGAAGAVDVDPQVGRRDLDLVVTLVDVRHDEHPGSRGMDAPLALGDGDPLDPMHAALKLQPRPRRFADVGSSLGAQCDSRLFDAAEIGLRLVEHLGLPTATLGIPQVHPQQVTGEQGRLIPALPRLDLEDRVPVVVGIARQQEGVQAALGQRRDRLDRR